MVGEGLRAERPESALLCRDSLVQEVSIRPEMEPDRRENPPNPQPKTKLKRLATDPQISVTNFGRSTLSSQRVVSVTADFLMTRALPSGRRSARTPCSQPSGSL